MGISAVLAVTDALHSAGSLPARAPASRWITFGCVQLFERVGGTSSLWSSLTTEDFPMPEYPDTSTSSDVPPATNRSNEARRLPISLSPPTQPLRDREAVGGIMRSERERVDPTLRLPFR
jgi:hypothetical protein